MADLPRQEVVTESTLDAASSIAVPDDLIQITDVIVNGIAMQLRYVPDWLRTAQDGGPPKFFTIFNGRIKVAPDAIGQSVILAYYGRFPVPVADSDTNHLMDWAEDVVTYGALSFLANAFEDAREPTYEEKFITLATEVKEEVLDQKMATSSGMALENPYE
ncbi:MAG: hypothetical protein HC888_00950 [Candidatus Competibacteraceae bacterium]|nr:hypothetical protein [Candidatus Competibacteraceae bacterium]